MKRARTSSSDMGLTGGSGDINPQWLTSSTTQSAADTATTSQLTLPVQRLPESANKALVMEILRVYFQFPTFGAFAAAAESTDRMTCALTTKNFSTTAISLDEPTCFAIARVVRQGAFTAAGTYGYQESAILSWDCTDGAGHGVLVATDSIFSQVSSTGTGNANQVQFKILYRWKKVSLSEYIGIVQGQQ